MQEFWFYFKNYYHYGYYYYHYHYYLYGLNCRGEIFSKLVKDAFAIDTVGKTRNKQKQ